MQRPASSTRDQANLTTIILLAAGLVLTLAARIYRIGDYGLWRDEVFSLRVVRSSWSGMFGQVAADVVHPPLFYILLKIWVGLGGESLIWLRTLPLLFAFGTLGALYLLTRELQISLREYAITILIVALNSFLILYSREVRMYSMLTFLSVLSMWAFVKFLQAEAELWKPVLYLAAVNLALVYTHYFGLLTIAAELGVLLWLKRRKLSMFLVQGGVVAVGFAPWVFTVGTMAAKKGGLEQNVGWIGRPGLAAVPQLLAQFQGDARFARATTIGLIIFGLPIILWLWQTRRNSSGDISLTKTLLGLAAVVPIAATFIFSNLFPTSAWVDRYMISAAVPYLLLAAVSANRMTKAGLRYVLVAILIIWSVAVGAWNLAYPNDRVDWLGFAKQIAVSPGKPVYVLEPWTEMPISEALRTVRSDRSVLSISSLNDVSTGASWVLYRRSVWQDPETPEAILRSGGCTIAGDSTQAIVQDEVHLLDVECTPR